MKYAIIGAGGTGGSLGFFLTKAGKDVTLIARGKHLEAIRKNGLGMERLWDHKREMLQMQLSRQVPIWSTMSGGSNMIRTWPVSSPNMM